MSTNFKIRFEGELHQVDANLLISNLIHVTSIIQEINRELNNGKKISIQVRALEKGSFAIDLNLIESVVGATRDLFTKESTSLLADVLTIFTGIIGIKQFLKGEESTSKEVIGDKVKIKNKDGNALYVKNLTINVYEKNPAVKDALSSVFEALDEAPAVTGYAIDKGEENLVRVPRDEFEFMASRPDTLSANERNVIKNSIFLSIVRISFDSKLSSDFYYEGG